MTLPPSLIAPYPGDTGHLAARLVKVLLRHFLILIKVIILRICLLLLMVKTFYFPFL